ncbi:MAG: 2-isopropylmalate synthase [Spirochaetaceae bacterium]|nr:MAG: 2-isopropylmalate synthase [Spirochaetaceae bacterium]
MAEWMTGDWWVSQYNYLKEYRAQFETPSNVIIHDTTLRDGEQTPGVVFSKSEKVEIARMLDELGVERIEAGMPAVSTPDFEAIQEITSLGLKARIYSFARASQEDIDMASECGVDGVIIEIPTSEPKLRYQFPKWSKADVIERSLESVRYAKTRGLEAVYFGYDTTRADYGFLEELYSAVVLDGKADSVGIVDTMGCTLPGAMTQLIRRLRQQFETTFEIHAHNDFGLGTAISFAAMEAGAAVIHTCVNGMGERTGNAPLEQIAVGLKVLYGLNVKYRLELLDGISEKVAEFSGFPVPVNKPIVGRNVFCRESGIGIDLVMDQPLAMFGLAPSTVGKQGGVVLGKKSGKKSITHKLAELGLRVNDESSAIEKILAEVKDRSIRTKGLVSDEDFVALVKPYLERE